MSKSPQKPQDDEERRPQKKGTQAAAWVLTGLLVLGLGGFGVTNFGGTVTTIGSVGGTPITTQDYANALRQEIAAAEAQYGIPNISVPQALEAGLDRRALSMVVTNAAFDEEMARIGLSLGDTYVSKTIKDDNRLKDMSGNFSDTVYRDFLRQQGLTDRTYESGLRRYLSRSVVQGAVLGGFEAPQPAIASIYRYESERRSFSMIRLAPGDLVATQPDPTDAELQAWHTDNIARFTKPEARRIAYAVLLPDAIAPDQAVDEEALQKMYNDRIDEFVVPERRLVERLVFPDQAAADAAKAKLDAGLSFEGLVTEIGTTMSAIDLGDVSQPELGPAGDAVFAAEEGTAVLAESSLGPAIFRVNGTLAGENLSFEEAREFLAVEMQGDAARRLIADKVETIDDLLAGGASLKALASELGMVYATLDHVPGLQGAEGIEGYTNFRAAAEAATLENFPEAIILDDGGVVALQFLELVPAAPIPFDQAKDAVEADWRAAKLAEALSARAIEMKVALEAGAAIGSLGIVDQTPGITRRGVIDGAPTALIEAAFAMAPGDIRVIEQGNFIAVLVLNEVLPGDDTSEDAAALKSIVGAQMQQAISDDALAAFSAALIAGAEQTLDGAAITAVHSGLQ